MRLVKLRKRWGPTFAGETVGVLDEKASELIAAGVAVEVDQDGNEIAVEPVAEKSVGEEGSQAGRGYKFDEATDPFVVDGLSRESAIALHDAGLDSPGEVSDYLRAGKSLADVLSAAQAKKALSLYKPDTTKT